MSECTPRLPCNQRYCYGHCSTQEFKPGDRVSYCGDEATVVANWGGEGTVRDDAGNQMRWYWMFQGEPVRLVRKA